MSEYNLKPITPPSIAAQEARAKRRKVLEEVRARRREIYKSFTKNMQTRIKNEDTDSSLPEEWKRNKGI